MSRIKDFNIAQLRIEKDFGLQKHIEADGGQLQSRYDKFMVATAVCDAEESTRPGGFLIRRP